MTDPAAVQAFILKWEANVLNEAANSKEHFIDLCRLLDQKTPNEADPKGEWYRFEKPLTKSGGKAGFADVWRKDRFAWEYKTKGKYPTLEAAYQQLLLYKGDLGNPPVLVACDIATYEVHIEFNGYRSRVERFTNADLQNASTRELLRQVFTAPEELRPVERQTTVTEVAAARLARVAEFLERRKFAPTEIAHFFMRVLFALFAEDIKLLPGQLMSQSIKQTILKPEEFVPRTRALFRAMRQGDYFGMDLVPRFNGWLYDDDTVLPLNADELTFLNEAAKLDWSQIEPAIFGTLFERSLDKSKRAQLGAHYTSREDILLIVEPVLMQPLRREWAEVQAGVEALHQQWETQTGNARRKLISVAEGMLLDFVERLSKVRVLDPACGSGNFLYVALNQLKDLEHEVWRYAGGLGLEQPELSVSPAQLFGIEKNQFAAELAQVVVWIGYLQWKRKNGFFDVEEPVLQSLNNIQCRDAILAVDLEGKPTEPEWPEADVIVGNPPFLGDKKMRRELGDTYVDSLRQLYGGRIPGGADLVTYWFERSRALIQDNRAKRAGLLATNSIRGGANRKVLERIKRTGDIFLAWSDRDWVLDGAAVNVSMVGFDSGSEQVRVLDGKQVLAINADLTSVLDLTQARRLLENVGISYLGVVKVGKFEISREAAQKMMSSEAEAGGKSLGDVIRPWVNGLDITGRHLNRYIIDFGSMTEEVASEYKEPFDYIRVNVKPFRDANKRERRRLYWWQHGETIPALRTKVAALSRYIGTARVAKHRLFVWLPASTLPDYQVVATTREDDYFFGVLHACPHELWSLRLGTSLEDRPRYTPSTTFETYPFPWAPGKEPLDDPRVEAIAEAARELVAARDSWLAGNGPPEMPLEKRTLTQLYNKRPDWLSEAHRKLDEAVFAAYGWPSDISDDDILARLLALNLERAAGQGEVAAVEKVEDAEADE